MTVDKYMMEVAVNKVSESIWSGAFITIPMADVQHTEKHFNNEEKLIGGWVVTKHSKKNAHGEWENAIWLHGPSFESFMKAWCFYRHEVEGGVEAFIQP